MIDDHARPGERGEGLGPPRLCRLEPLEEGLTPDEVDGLLGRRATFQQLETSIWDQLESADPAFVAKSARAIDVHIASWYKKQKLEVPQVTDDATFLRRVFLVAIGRIPTGEEARAFLEIDDPAKRTQLIDYLMQSKGYSSHMTN